MIPWGVARQNPYPTEGQVTLRGRGSDRDHYSYRGHDFDVARAAPPPAGYSRSPRWIWTAAGKDVGVRGAPTRDAAIERLRIWIDRSIYYDTLPEAEKDGFFTMEGEIMLLLESCDSPQSTTRANIARWLKQAGDSVRQRWQDGDCKNILAAKMLHPSLDECEELDMRKTGFDFFDALPLWDRVRWIDAHVKDHRLAMGFPLAGPTKKNPRRKKPKKDRRKLLSRLLRGT